MKYDIRVTGNLEAERIVSAHFSAEILAVPVAMGNISYHFYKQTEPYILIARTKIKKSGYKLQIF